MLICNKCGKTGKRGKFCVYCGGELSEFFTLKTAESETEPVGECPECGRKFSEGSFCIFCGVALNKIGGTVDEVPAPVVETTVDEVPAPVVETTVDEVPAPVVETSVDEVPAPVVETAVDEVPAPVVETTVNEVSAPVKLRCTICGYIMDKGKFCTVCGGQLAPVEEEKAPEVAPAPAAVPSVLKCSICGKIHEKGKFCTSCGGQLVAAEEEATAAETVPVQTTPVQSAPVETATVQPAAPLKLKCPDCGKKFERGKFCTVCGVDLVPDEEPAEVNPLQPAQTIPTPVDNTPVIPAPVAAEPKKLRCAECGKIMDKGKFCTSCGGNLVPFDDAPAQTVNDIPTAQPVMNTAPAPAPQTSGLVCPACGKTFERGKFCTVCGTTLVPQSQNTAPADDGLLHCVQCGKTFEKGKFCTVCGGKLVTSAEMNV